MRPVIAAFGPVLHDVDVRREGVLRAGEVVQGVDDRAGVGGRLGEDLARERAVANITPDDARHIRNHGRHARSGHPFGEGVLRERLIAGLGRGHARAQPMSVRSAAAAMSASARVRMRVTLAGVP